MEKKKAQFLDLDAVTEPEDNVRARHSKSYRGKRQRENDNPNAANAMAAIRRQTSLARTPSIRRRAVSKRLTVTGEPSPRPSLASVPFASTAAVVPDAVVSHPRPLAPVSIPDSGANSQTKRVTIAAPNDPSPPPRGLVTPPHHKHVEIEVEHEPELSTLQEIWLNLRPGLTVAILNVPMSLGLGAGARVHPLAGIRTAAWAGLIAGMLGGSQFNIVGPTGGLTTMLTRYAVTLSDPDDKTTVGLVVPWMAMIVGVMLAVVYALRLERFVEFMPTSVTRGFMLGLALMIVGNQINPIMGYTQDSITVFAEFRDNVVESLRRLPDADPIAFFTTVVFFGFIFGMTQVSNRPNVPTFVARCPWPVVGAALGIGWGYLCHTQFGIHYQTMEDAFGVLQPDLFHFPAWPSFLTSDQVADLLLGCVYVAFVVMLETFVAGKIADTMVHNSVMNANQEALGLCIANVLSGFAGGLPASAALSRTLTNIRQGATCRYSSIINAAFLFAYVPLVVSYFSFLPLCVLSSFNLMVAFSLVQTDDFKRFYREDKFDFYLCLSVALLCVLADPTTGLFVGMLISLIRFSDNATFAHSEMVIVSHDPEMISLCVERLRHPAGENGDDGDDDDDWAHAGEVEHRPTGVIRGFLRCRKWCRKTCGAKKPETGDGSMPSTDTSPRTATSTQRHTATKQQRPPTATAATDDDSNPVKPDTSGQKVLDVLDEEVVTEYRIIGKLTYFNGFQHSTRFRRFDIKSRMILSFKYCVHVDIDGLAMINTALKEYEDKSQHRVLIVGVNDHISGVLNRVEWYKERKAEGVVFGRFEDAVKWHLRAARQEAEAERAEQADQADPDDDEAEAVGEEGQGDSPAAANTTTTAAKFHKTRARHQLKPIAPSGTMLSPSPQIHFRSIAAMQGKTSEVDFSISERVSGSVVRTGGTTGAGGDTAATATASGNTAAAAATTTTTAGYKPRGVLKSFTMAYTTFDNFGRDSRHHSSNPKGTTPNSAAEAAFEAAMNQPGTNNKR